MKKVLITRYGAVGDHVHASHLPRALKEMGFDYVAIECNTKGQPVWARNPFVDEIIYFEVSDLPSNLSSNFTLNRRWEMLVKQGSFTKHINLQHSLEYGYIAMEDQNEYYQSTETRRKMYGKLNYYDQTSLWAGYPELVGRKGELYFDHKLEENVKKLFERLYKDKFVVICNIAGTSKHKLFYDAEKIMKEFINRHEDVVVITTGDDSAKEYEFKGERIVNRCGTFLNEGKEVNYTFMQSMLMCKNADCVIGCESGLMVASNALEVPTIQLMTAASILNHGGECKNDYSLQSPAKCAPCHKGPYDYIGCPKFEYKNDKFPVCIKFDKDVILNRLEEVYANSPKKCKDTALSAV
jgi:ADP-heptose:LPS heptosyltransferase